MIVWWLCRIVFMGRLELFGRRNVKVRLIGVGSMAEFMRVVKKSIWSSGIMANIS